MLNKLAPGHLHYKAFQLLKIPEWPNELLSLFHRLEWTRLVWGLRFLWSWKHKRNQEKNWLTPLICGTDHTMTIIWVRKRKEERFCLGQTFLAGCSSVWTTCAPLHKHCHPFPNNSSISEWLPEKLGKKKKLAGKIQNLAIPNNFYASGDKNSVNIMSIRKM